MNKEQILIELQMITGVVSNDVMYLYNLLVAAPETREVAEEVHVQNESNCGVTLNLDSWFTSI